MWLSPLQPGTHVRASWATWCMGNERSLNGVSIYLQEEPDLVTRMPQTRGRTCLVFIRVSSLLWIVENWSTQNTYDKNFAHKKFAQCSDMWIWGQWLINRYWKGIWEFIPRREKILHTFLRGAGTCRSRLVLMVMALINPSNCEKNWWTLLETKAYQQFLFSTHRDL